MQIRLYELRKEADLSQKDLGKLIGVTDATYRSKELGRQDFKSTEMFKIANFFHKKLDDIFTEETSRNVS